MSNNNVIDDDYGNNSSHITLAEISGRNTPVKWRVNIVSALYNFRHKESEQYVSKIKKDLTCETKFGRHNNFFVKIRPVQELRRNSKDPIPVVITVAVNVTNYVYQGILISWGIWTKVPNCVHLPFLLERGDKDVGLSVKNTLSNLFDCTINSCIFKELHLMQFGFELCEMFHAENMQFTMTYTNDKTDHRLTVKFDIKDVYDIWMICKSKYPNAVSRGYHLLQQQITQCFGIDATMMTLLNVSMPKVSFKSDGVISMSSLSVKHLEVMFDGLNSMLQSNKLIRNN